MTDADKNSVFQRFSGNSPAHRAEIERVQENLRFRLPTSYVQFMLGKNGGEGFVGQSYLVLWKMEELISKNIVYHVAEFVPELFLFGSNGGGEAFGFDTRSEVCEIVSIPFVAMDLHDAKIVAADFAAFLAKLSAS
jgi:hypothetical protein